jgi:hypothetical protein
MRTAPGKPSSQDGLTLVELLFLIAMTTVAISVFSRFILGTRNATARQEASGELMQRGMRISTNLRSGLQGAELIIANYADNPPGGNLATLHGIVYSSVIASGAPAPVTFSCWPTVVNEGMVDLSQDAGAVDWGNEIMYVSELNPITFTAQYNEPNGNTPWVVGPSTTPIATSAEVVSVPRYQFVYDYLSWDTGTALAGKGMALRLTEWRSQPYINYSSLFSFVDVSLSAQGYPRLSASCAYLTQSGYTLAFAAGNVTATTNCGTCFYPLVAAGVPSPITYTPVLPMYSWANMDDYDVVQSFAAKPLPGNGLGAVHLANGDAGGRTAAPGTYSIAFNDVASSGGFSAANGPFVTGLQGPGGALTVPQYALLNYGGAHPGFPAGFEISVGGGVSSREIFMRVVLMASNAGTESNGTFQAFQENSEISVATQNDW